MKKLIFLISLSFCIISCTQNPGDKTSETKESKDSLTSGDLDFALEFINGYIDNLNKGEDQIDMLDWANSNKLVTPEFKKDLLRIIDEANREDPDWGLGYDPILNAQDYPQSGFEIVSFDPVSNLIYFQGIDWDDFKLTLMAKRVDGVWLVDGCGDVNMPKEDLTEEDKAEG